ncbi:MAG: aminopeptidase P family protein [Bacteroidales bacterium]
MFSKEVYIKRRQELKKQLGKGIVLFLGNREVPFNYPANTYRFRQDSSFSYFFGLDDPDLAALIDIGNDYEILFGNDLEIEDIIWMGPQPSMKERAALVGVNAVKPLNALEEVLGGLSSGSAGIHYFHPYRADLQIVLSDLLKIPVKKLKKQQSEELIRAIINLRSVKEEVEIAEIEKMVDVAREMHTTVMQLAKDGVHEAYLTGIMEGIPVSHGGQIAFPIILSKHGETLHNHVHTNVLHSGDLLISDAGAEGALHYASDITRTTPVGGKFSARQKEIYEIVLQANLKAISMSKPGILYRDVHLAAAQTIASGLIELGLMKGNPEEVVAAGAHALFFPHGLGHMLGLDVHDLENMGENLVGYTNEIKRSEQFGTAYLRLGKQLQKGYVITDEPGIYFIPALIDLWKAEKKHEAYINYAQVEKYRDFGGIRLEDDLLITDSGCRVLGKPIPKTVAEVEAIAGRG